MRASSLVEFIIHFFHNQVVSFFGGRSQGFHALNSLKRHLGLEVTAENLAFLGTH
jgi:hypothetical protein